MLTLKQEMFAKEYLVDFNATQAALRAGYSEKTARDIGCENLSKPNIQQEIQRLIEERSKRTEITADKVLKELAAIAFADSTDYAKIKHKTIENELTGKKEEIPYIEFTDTDNLSKEQRKAISAIKYTKNGIAVETYSKIRALELLAKHLGMFDEHQEEQIVTVKIQGVEDYAI
ncbi:MAG: terminase small subunit [Ruminococcus sp.]|nr:terminase small subunit [Ruminococcus sp.]